jgi:hypothetical protein
VERRIDAAVLDNIEPLEIEKVATRIHDGDYDIYLYIHGLRGGSGSHLLSRRQVYIRAIGIGHLLSQGGTGKNEQYHRKDSNDS